MAESSFPFYGVDTSEAQFAKWASTLIESGVDTGLAITAGSGMQVLVAAGVGIVRGVYYENTASLALAIGTAPATAGQTRKDAVILRLDQTANSIVLAIKPGTANTSGGSLPALTQNDTTWETLIGTVTVANGTSSITTAMITDLKPSTGQRVLVYTAATRPTPTDQIALGLDTTNKRLEMWIVSTWYPLNQLDDMTGTLSVGNGGTGVTTLKALRQALDIYVQTSAPGHKAGRVYINGTPLA